MSFPRTCDFLIIGGGIVGLTVAREAKRRHPGATITVIDKEPGCGRHASTRNSGVLHAGFYYTADSLKAKLTVEGNRRLTEYCLERRLRIRQCGKLVVPTTPAELERLGELEHRGHANGVTLQRITAEEARAIEPKARVLETALFAPSTSSVDPHEVVEALLQDVSAAGVHVGTGTTFLQRTHRDVRTNRGPISPGYVINAAGLYADRVARCFGFGRDHVILPFKGLYLKQTDGPAVTRTHIYPVPDLHYPWLGVHFTVAVDGGVKLGPTAIPAFWREHYSGLRNFRLREMLEIVTREMRLMWRNEFGFRRLAVHELRKYSRGHLVKLGRALLGGVDPAAFRQWGPAGIRAQLLDTRTGRLEMDFCLEGDGDSMHILNAVSPAFTCSLSFAEYVLDEIERRAA